MIVLLLQAAFLTALSGKHYLLSWVWLG